MNTIEKQEPVVSIGIDAAVVTAHQVAIRGPGIAEDFRVQPTLAGLEELTVRLADWAPAMVVAEPTAGTWLPLLHAITESGCRAGFVANRDSARLRKAIAGANKTDVIDADLLARSPEILGVEQAPIPPAGQIGLRRAMRRRHRLIVEAHRVDCRLWALSAWAFPDVWRACGGHSVAQPILDRWNDIRALSRARTASIAEIVAAHSRDKNPIRRAERIKAGASGWSEFWIGRLDLDDLAWEIGQCLDDIAIADAKLATTTERALERWQQLWPDDVLRTIPGIGPICAASIRGWWGEGTHLRSAKAAAAHVGLNPSNWESGQYRSPSRHITKQGPADLRLLLYQAANVTRHHDPGLAAHYHRLMCDRGHTHISATSAIARKLAGRAWKILQTQQPYEVRDLDGNPIDPVTAKAICAELAVPTDTRRRNRATQQGRLAR
jgi:transposase